MTHASVFSGIGGPEVAAAMLGWDNLFHCEINPFGRKVLEFWFPNSKSYEDITQTDFSEWGGQIDVLTGGFPCQPFSNAGQRRGAEDDRYLWPFMHKCINQVRPTWVVAENVAGILTMVEQGQTVAMESEAALFSEGDGLHRYKQRAIFTLERICRDIEADGYEVQPILIPACGVGAPHRRDRVFIIGHRIAPDTDLSANMRGSRKDESKSKSKRLQERDQVRQPDQSNQIRSKSPDFSQDTMCGRFVQSQTEKQGNVRNVRNVRNAGSRDSERLRTSTSRTGSSESRTNEIKRSVFADTFGLGWIERIVDNGFSQTPQQKECRVKQPGRANKPQDRWRGFPTVSPIHRGNDGIPFDVDRLSVPFGKWCTESIKAYGNAIVPQVMFEIFRAIEKVEKIKG